MNVLRSSVLQAYFLSYAGFYCNYLNSRKCKKQLQHTWKLFELPGEKKSNE